MGVRVPITPDKLSAALIRRFSGIDQAISDGMYKGALYGQALLAHRTPRNTGAAAAQWKVSRRALPALGAKVSKRSVQAELVNDSPYIGVLEYGARPHPVSKEGIAAIARWAFLKLGVSAEKAQEIAQAIAWKIRRHGVAAHYFVRDSRGEIQAQTGKEILKAINAISNKRNP